VWKVAQKERLASGFAFKRGVCRNAQRERLASDCPFKRRVCGGLQKKKGYRQAVSLRGE
jgi:hypothetical protein